ncbi:MAG: hypothetical protein RIQ59_2064 [Bacteroidota bacterium]|jgi:type IX secretion system PorP/SprF family membrane protein
MKKINYIVLIALLFVSNSILAQQESAFAFYRSNMNIVNPAYAGVDNETLLTTALRQQWTGIPEAPQTATFAFSMPLKKNVGMGISLANDKVFIENQTFLGIDFSYKLKMNETIDMYLGVKAGGNFYKVNTTGLETYNVMSDPALGSINFFNPNIGAGAVVKTKKWNVSLSVPRLISTTRAKNDSGYASTDIDRPHFYLSGGYDFEVSNALVLKPSVMLRYVNGAPVSIDLNSMLQIEKKFEFGVTYRTDKAYGMLASIKLSNHLLFGYAYEMSTRATMAMAKNTNELLLQYKF